MRVERLLYFCWPDLEARDVDHVLDTIDDRDIAVVVHGAHVAAVEPPAAQRLRALFSALPVPLHHTWSTDHDLSPGAQLDRLVGVVHDPQFEVLDSGSDSARPASEVVVVAGERGSLGQPVTLEDRAAELRLPAGADLIRQGRCRRELVADVSQVARRDPGREQVDVDHRHGEELRDPIPLDRLEHLAWLEPAVEHDRGTGAEASVDDEVLPEDVKQRQEQDQPVVVLVAAMVGGRP